MLRRNTERLSADLAANEAANDTRDTPLNRLLRKQGPAPQAPVGKPLTTQAPVPEEPVSQPPTTQASVPASPVSTPMSAQVAAPATPVSNPLSTPAPAPEIPAAKPMSAPVVAPEMPVGRPPSAKVSTTDKLDGQPMAAPVAAPETPVSKPLATPVPAPELLDGKPVDVEFTPLETPAIAPQGRDATAAEAPVRKLLPAHDVAPRTPSAKPLDKHVSTQETPAAGPLEAPAPALETSPDKLPPKRESTPEAPTANPLDTRTPLPEAPAAGPLDAPDPLLQTSIDSLLPKRESIPEAPVAKPHSARGSALATTVGKLLPGRDAAPETPSARALLMRDGAAEKSVSKMLAIPRRTRDEREFLPAALEIVDTPPSPVGRAIGFTIIAVAVLAIAWACIGKVDIVATAGGRIVPQGKSKIVQPADTGIVTAIHVADGDHVKAGDPLIELNSNQVTADRDRFQRDLLQANLNLARLRGLAATLPGTPAEGRAPDLVDPPKDAKPEDLTLTLAAMRAQAANENAKLADLDQQVEAKQAEAAEAAAATEKLQASLPMVADQEKILRAMRDQKVGSKLDWYQVNQQLIEQQHEISVLAHRKDAAVAAQRALREQRAAEAAQYQMSVLADLDKMRAQVSELEAELAKAQQRLSQVVLHAPIAGTVQQLAVHTIGGVVTPAEALLTIVPDEGGLVVEAAVRNRDVGFIRAGQTVRVKVEAFNFTLYGLINGEVLDVTRDAVSHSNDKKGNGAGDQNDGSNVASDDNSGPVYLARIALSQDWMMTENGKVPLAPGMAVTAEIQTGERRLISYLLSPLVRHVSESMHER